jgi:hypothetical protein
MQEEKEKSMHYCSLHKSQHILCVSVLSQTVSREMDDESYAMITYVSFSVQSSLHHSLPSPGVFYARGTFGASITVSDEG